MSLVNTVLKIEDELQNIGLTKDQINKTFDIFSKNEVDIKGIPHGTITITVEGSRTRIGKTLISAFIYNKLEEIGYDVIQDPINKVTDNIDNMLKVLTTKTFSSSPRANVIIINK